MENKGRYILLVKKTDDKKTRYITAKKLAIMFRTRPFSDWKTRLDKGSTVIMRSDSLENVEAHKQSLELLGAELDITVQKDIGGMKVF